MKSGEAIWVSGEQAVPHLLRPASTTLYVRELDRNLAIANRWRSDGEPNIVVRRKFWNAPEGDGEPSGTPPAPWPLVYADLLESQDPRARNAATELVDRYEGSEQDA
jgi:hypothetical protein